MVGVHDWGFTRNDDDARSGAADQVFGSPLCRARPLQVGAIMFSRFAVMPFVAAGLLLCGRRAGLIPFDKLLWFVLLMEG